MHGLHFHFQGLGSVTASELGSESEDEDGPRDYSDADSLWNEEEVEISPEDEEAMAAFMQPGFGEPKQRTLADIILDKIKEKQERQMQQEGYAPCPGPVMNLYIVHSILCMTGGVWIAHRSVGTPLIRGPLHAGRMQKSPRHPRPQS